MACAQKVRIQRKSAQSKGEPEPKATRGVKEKRLNPKNSAQPKKRREQAEQESGLAALGKAESAG